MRFTEQDLEIKKQEFPREQFERTYEGVEWKKFDGGLYTLEEMIDTTINSIVEKNNPLTEERRPLVQTYMEYEFGNGTKKRMDEIMDLVDEYDRDNRIYVDLENQECRDEDLMCWVQDKLIYGTPDEWYFNDDYVKGLIEKFNTKEEVFNQIVSKYPDEFPHITENEKCEYGEDMERKTKSQIDGLWK